MTSFEDFHRQRARHALHYARAILGSDSAEDVCQEAWLRAWRCWGSADPERLDAWLLTIVRNCCFDRLRATRPVAVLEEGDLAPVPAAEEAVVAALELAAAWVLLQRLSPPLREVLWLREVMNLSYAEIAEVQRVPVGTVMSRLHAARKKAVRLLDRREGR
jgi:RNA polymerase sigma-70 factor (ECF subfamily)